MEKLLDAIHDNVKLVNDVCYEIEDLALAADMIGNPILARKLRQYVSPLRESAKAISDAHSEELNTQIKHNNDVRRRSKHCKTVR